MTLDTDIKRPENSHIWQREEHEHYVEPEWCSRRLLEVETFNHHIWDPCCGFGHIPKTATARGHTAWASDIVDRGFDGTIVGDFLKTEVSIAEQVICNPPFDIFQKFATHALALGCTKVAMIWLVRTLPAARWLRSPIPRSRRQCGCYGRSVAIPDRRGGHYSRRLRGCRQGPRRRREERQYRSAHCLAEFRQRRTARAQVAARRHSQEDRRTRRRARLMTEV